MVKLSDEMATGEHLELRFHGAMPKWAKVVGLKIKAVPKSEGGGLAVDREQAERLVACWDACRGIETADLVQDVPPDSPAGIARKAVKRADAAEGALKKISRGRPDNGRPLGGEFTRQLARKVLTDAGVGWSRLGDEGEG